MKNILRSRLGNARFLLSAMLLHVPLAAMGQTCSAGYEPGTVWLGWLGGLFEYANQSNFATVEALGRALVAEAGVVIRQANPTIATGVTYDGPYAMHPATGSFLWTEYGPDGHQQNNNTAYYPGTGCIKKTQDRWHDKDYCAPQVGKPILPLTGAKRLDEIVVDQKSVLINLHFDTRLMIDGDLSGGNFADRPFAFGLFWSNEHFKRLVVQQNASEVHIWRGAGSWESFTRVGTSYISDGDVNDRLISSPSGWTVFDMQVSSEEQYDQQGALTTRAYVSGRRLTYQYSDGSTAANLAPFAGLLLSIRDNFGRSISFQYGVTSGGYAHVTRVIDSIGQQVLIDYSASGGIARLAWSDGSQKQYLYERADLPGAVTGILDENASRLATYSYDGTGHAVDSQWSGGAYHYSTSYSVLPSWNVVESYDSASDVFWRDHSWMPPQGLVVNTPLGASMNWGVTSVQGMTRLTSQSQPAGSGCGASSSSMSYDGNGNIASETDFNGHTTTHSYDTSRNLELQRVEASGTAAARTVSTTWHPFWRLEATRAEPLKRTTWVYNGQPDPIGGGTASCAPGSAPLPDGQPIAVLCRKVEQATTDASGWQGFGAPAVGTPRVWQWTYDGDGQVLTAKGPRTDVNDTTTYVYRTSDDTGSPMKYRRGDLYSVTDPLGHVTTMPEYDLNGRLTRMIDPNGLVTTMSYSPRGWLTDRVATSASGVIEATHYDYDGVGQMTKAIQPDGSYVTYVYDAAHRLTDVADGLGNGIHYTLDAMGNRTQEQVKDPSGVLAQNITRNYDALNRLQTVTGALQ